MDIYSNAVNFFRNNPNKIPEIWDDPKSHWAGVLFQSVTPDGTSQINKEGFLCGDLCEIRSSCADAWNLELQMEIMNDPRLPKIYASNNYIPQISIEALDVFAEWQRKIDKALNRSPNNFKFEE